jgi:hypothetical protein
MTVNELTFYLQGEDGASCSGHGMVWKINQQFPESYTVRVSSSPNSIPATFLVNIL